MSNHKFTRKEFYNLVWSKPLTKIASELDVKDALIRKICKKYNIPLPKVGYWKKLEFKKEVIIEKLPEDEKLDQVLIDIKALDLEYKEGDHFKLSQRKKEIEAQFPKELVVPKRLAKPVLLVQKAKAYLEKQSPRNWDGFENAIKTTSGHLSISVTKKNARRMLRFIDSFIKLLEKRGHHIKVIDWDTVVVVNQEEFKIKFHEKCSRKKIESSSWNRYELIPNGLLSMKLVFPWKTIEWVDGRKPLEQQLSKIVASLELRAEKEKIDRAKREKYRAEQRRLQAIRDQEEAKKRLEKRKIEMLLDHSSKWKVVRNLELFIASIESVYDGKEVPLSVLEWMNWAKNVQKSVNPISTDIESYVEVYNLSLD